MKDSSDVFKSLVNRQSQATSLFKKEFASNEQASSEKISVQTQRAQEKVDQIEALI